MSSSITAQKPAVERGGSGQSNASPPQPHPITSWFVDVSFTDDVPLFSSSVFPSWWTFVGTSPAPKGIYRGPGFLAVAWFGSTPTPSRQHVASLSRFSCRSAVELTDRKRRGGVGLEPNHSTARKPGPLKIVHHSLPRPLSTSGSFSNDLWRHCCLFLPQEHNKVTINHLKKTEILLKIVN